MLFDGHQVNDEEKVVVKGPTKLTQWNRKAPSIMVVKFTCYNS